MNFPPRHGRSANGRVLTLALSSGGFCEVSVTTGRRRPPECLCQGEPPIQVVVPRWWPQPPHDFLLLIGGSLCWLLAPCWGCAWGSAERRRAPAEAGFEMPVASLPQPGAFARSARSSDVKGSRSRLAYGFCG